MKKPLSNSSIDRGIYIKSKLGVSNYNFQNFLACSEYTLEELIYGSRLTHIVETRQVGMVWYFLGSNNLADTARVFQRDHATVIHAIKNIINALDLPSQYPHIIELLDKCKTINVITQVDKEVNALLLLQYAINPVLDLNEPTLKVSKQLVSNRVKNLYLP